MRSLAFFCFQCGYTLIMRDNSPLGQLLVHSTPLLVSSWSSMSYSMTAKMYLHLNIGLVMYTIYEIIFKMHIYFKILGLLFNTFSSVLSYNHVDYNRLMNSIYGNHKDDPQSWHQSSLVKQSCYFFIISGLKIG